jgi:hypothetical protein
MVTPPYKEGFPFLTDEVSEDGSQVLVESFGNLLTPEDKTPDGTGPLLHAYRLVRTDVGWKSMPVDAPFSTFADIEVESLSPDFGTSTWSASAQGESSADIYLDLPSGLVRVGPAGPPGALESSLRFAGGSEDLRHALFFVHSPKVGLEEEHLWPGDTTHPDRRPSLYEYAGTGLSEPSLVGVKNQTSVSETAKLESKTYINQAAELISNCGTVLGSYPEGDTYNAIGADGKTVFFTSEECGGTPPVNELYARIGGEKTVAISEPPMSIQGRDCTTEECMMAENVSSNRKAAVFAGASLDGSRVFFSTNQPLVNADTDNGPDLYEEDISGHTVTRLVQVSRGGVGDPTPGVGANVLGVARVSEDGSHVYFVARGVLAGANGRGKFPMVGEPNLYVSVRECAGGGSVCGNPVEHTSFIGTLSGADAADWNPINRRPAQATPDGRFLVFQSAADLTPDEEGEPEAGQVFEYDADTGILTRVSRGQNGYNSDGNSSVYPATIPVQVYEVDLPDTRFTHLAVSADGSRVFFTSSNSLTPQALAGVASVYEYHDEQVSLISDGHDVVVLSEGSATRLIGTDESGRNVFFTSADRLVPQDRDTWLDLYDARMEGGFTPPAISAPCFGDPCQGSGSAAPLLVGPGVPAGAGEAPVGAGTHPKAKVVKKKARKRKHTGRAHKRARGRGKR